MNIEQLTVASSKVGNFFAIDQRCWAKACSLGLNPAVAYLVLARGSGGDQRTTYWSVNAVETYTGISRHRAKASIEALQSAGLISSMRRGGQPRYEILPWSEIVGRTIKLSPAQTKLLNLIVTGDQPTKSDLKYAPKLVQQGILETDPDNQLHLPESQWIWLPNEFVTGAADETPPLELLRQTQDEKALRLVVDLYREQNLREDGGVDRRITWIEHERFEVGQQGQFTVWGFREGRQFVHWTDTTRPHRRNKKDLTEREKEDGENPGVDFFARMHILTDLGLVEWVTYLVESDGPEAEIIHPLAISNSDPRCLENMLGKAANDAGLEKLTEGQIGRAESKGLFLVPVPRHLSRVTVIGIARLRYRPKTSMTSAWWGELQNRSEQYIRKYAEMSGPNPLPQRPDRLATSRGVQGDIKDASKGYQRIF